MADGRTYTALSQTPPSLGSSLQLLSVFGSVVGWLFAKPFGVAKNGYQLTGAQFNHTADIYFPDTSDRVIISQEFLGHDVFDQITLESDIRGTIPTIAAGSRLEVTEYEEQYTTVEAGTIHSASTRTFVNKITGQKYIQRVSQTFIFNTCKFAPFSDEDNVSTTLKVIKNYLGYETRDNIVRYGTSNKIVLMGQKDPCLEGRNTCSPHSTCIAQRDTYTCVCQSGFTGNYVDGVTECVDIDECLAGIHNCDINADCYNHEGGFQCRCRDQFEGNGATCNWISRCKDKNCDSNAHCIDNPGEDPICLCKTGYTGDGQKCWKIQERPCDNCSPFGHCGYDSTNTLKCLCNPGYIGDGFYCTEAPEVTSPTEQSVSETTEAYYLHSVETTPSVSEAEYNATYVLPHCNILDCSCPKGYSNYQDKRGNDLCRIDSYRDPIGPLDNDTSSKFQYLLEYTAFFVHKKIMNFLFIFSKM